MKILLLILSLAAVSCNNQNENTGNTDSLTSKNENSSNQKDTIGSRTSGDLKPADGFENDSTILISFPKDSTWVTVNGKMKGINHPVTVLIPVKQGKQLTATISPEDSTANIRINQIFTPSGKADGPFGRELKRALYEQGTYKLILAENLMQGDEWKGNFKLTVKVQ
jgi:hypothetical protein